MLSACSQCCPCHPVDVGDLAFSWRITRAHAVRGLVRYSWPAGIIPLGDKNTLAWEQGCPFTMSVESTLLGCNGLIVALLLAATD